MSSQRPHWIQRPLKVCIPALASATTSATSLVLPVDPLYFVYRYLLKLPQTITQRI